MKEDDSIIRKTARATANSIKKVLVGEEKKLFSEFDEVVQITKEKLDEFIDRVTAKTFHALLILVGLAFALYGVVLMLQQELLLEKYVAFLMVGFLVVMISWLLYRK